MSCRYTKALDAIKNLRKERTADLKTEKERLSHLQLEKSRSEKVILCLHAYTQHLADNLSVESEDPGIRAVDIQDGSRLRGTHCPSCAPGAG